MTTFIIVALFQVVKIFLFVFIVQELKENSEKNADEDEAFQETAWGDLTHGFHGKLQKKVNMTLSSQQLHLKC